MKMAFPHLFFFIIISTLFLLSAANVHRTTAFHRSQPISKPPTTYFEVTRPILLPNTKPCSQLVLQHEFANTYNKPPVHAHYNPPSHCGSYPNFDKIVLEWTATCKGRQFDRIFGVWLGGVEILRSCTAEPTSNGIIWTVKKDITKYYSLLMANQTLAVYLGNVIDATYTGVYHVNVTFHFYPAVVENYSHGSGREVDNIGSRADLILPISRNSNLNGGLWFEIENSTDIQSKEFEIPKNTYKAVLEVYESFHENDEFWYSNYPNEYISVNNLTGSAGNGPFREVVVTLDNSIIGVVWPFTVIYTGGVNPLFWRPITGIGSFDLPSYDIEVTPMLGKILDGKGHKFAFSVTNALNVWYIDANLHLWVDKKSDRTQGKLLEHKVSSLSLSLESNFTGFDGVFVTNVSRSIISKGWVKSSQGTITTKSRQNLTYSNTMTMGNDGNLQILNQAIRFKSSIDTKKPSSSVQSTKLFRKFGLFMYYDEADKGNETYFKANVKLKINEKGRKSSDRGSSSMHRLKNLQNAKGWFRQMKGKPYAGLGSTKQDYYYRGDKSCYSRKVGSSNYTILHDKESKTCK